MHSKRQSIELTVGGHDIIISRPPEIQGNRKMAPSAMNQVGTEPQFKDMVGEKAHTNWVAQLPRPHARGRVPGDPGYDGSAFGLTTRWSGKILIRNIGPRR